MKPVFCLIILQVTAYPMCSNYSSVMTVLFSQTKQNKYSLQPLLPYFIYGSIIEMKFCRLPRRKDSTTT